MALQGSSIASTYLKLLRINTDTMGADDTASYIQDSADTDSALSISTTRVGIGTAVPAQVLHVKGNIHVEDNDSTDRVALIANSGDDGVFTLYANTSAKVSFHSNSVSYINGGSVGIGTAVPSSLLHIGDITSGSMSLTGNSVLITGDGDATDGIRITRDNGSQNQLDQFLHINNTGSASFLSAGGTSSHGGFIFYSTDDVGSSSTERMRIDSSGHSTFKGNIIIDETVGTTNSAVIMLKADRPSSDQTAGEIQFYNNHANAYAAILGKRGSADNYGDLVIKTRNSGSFGERMRIDEDGDVTFSGDLIMADGKGINFAAMTTPADAAGMTAETLTDYEEGTFSPVLESSAGDNETQADNGKYTKIGNMVCFSIYFSNIDNGLTMSGDITLTGLPFTSANITSCAMHINYQADTNLFSARIDSSSTTMQFYQRDVVNASVVEMTDSTIGDYTDINISGTYLV